MWFIWIYDVTTVMYYIHFLQEVKKCMFLCTFQTYEMTALRPYPHKLYTHYVTASNLNEQYLSAYRRQHRTETALLKLMNDLLMVAGNQQLELMAFLDLSPAFDSVDRSMLLSRLQSMFGVSGVALSWFASYLTGRTQSVTIGSVMSKERIVKCCVPQGSALGPTYMQIILNCISQYHQILRKTN